MITGVERELVAQRPALLVVYGDINSTLGAAIAAAKLRVPVAHVEAGLRSFDNDMPEEINRRLTDQLCDLLFATSAEAVGYLGNEGVNVQNVHLVGNTMIDTIKACLGRLDTEAARIAMGLPDRYMVATLHRPANVDDPGSLSQLVAALHEVADKTDIIIPMHPRGAAAFNAAGGRPPRHPHLRPAALPGLHVPRQGRVRGDHRFRWRPGRDYLSARSVPDPSPGHRTPGHRDQRQQPPRHPRRTARSRAGSPLSGPYTGELPPLGDGAAGPRIARIITDWIAERN